ncbi:cell envelope integrity protein CreD [uncultured Coprobacter sp.]|uniref:cell envelope integrity protein CreD n=1 Tax=uncultured Coprobacter sp. TaxID=1720550 RepID=UPI0026192B82|nr:cell envelope integrity protein CreD [uncultured Coprobacter sp.]
MEQTELTPIQEEAKKGNNKNNALTIKIILIALLIIVLIIPITMVQNMIMERNKTANEASAEVQQKWSKPQNITGPILVIPYKEYIEQENKMRQTDIRYLYILPEKLQISGNIETENLKRGLYDIVVYRSSIKLSGSFDFTDLQQKNITGQQLLLNEAKLTIGISDLHGITEQVEGKWKDEILSFNPGVNNPLILSGVSCPISLSNMEEEIPFGINLRIKGSESAMFTPLGKTTLVSLKSNCSTPSFTGAFLPENREVAENGFSATWKILNLNRNYPQVFTGENWSIDLNDSTFGVNLLLPVDQYQKSIRSIKYAFLIIILTFVICFFVEVLHKKNINPFQYLLIGLALCLFYTLLVSISEHLNFTLSYVIATTMTIGLLTFYLSGILKIKKTAITIGGMLLLLYTYIFILIQMEIYALLVGSIGLFIILAIIMYCSLKINWNTPINKR